MFGTTETGDAGWEMERLERLEAFNGGGKDGRRARDESNI
jgi:hypothetical protein